MFKVMYLLKSKSLPPQMFFSSIENLESQHKRRSPHFAKRMSYTGRADQG